MYITKIPNKIIHLNDHDKKVLKNHFTDVFEDSITYYYKEEFFIEKQITFDKIDDMNKNK
jgi:hypothetical protein